MSIQPGTPLAGLSLAQVRKLSPCKESYDRVSAILPKRGKITAAQAREAGCTLDDLVWLASALARTDKSVERRLRHWMADCAERVLHIYERDCPNDSRPRDAIAAARDYADGRIADAAWDAAWDAAGVAARDAAGVAAWDAARDAAWDAEKQWQFDRLILWLAENEPEALTLAKGGK